jgi:hypothetical protein
VPLLELLGSRQCLGLLGVEVLERLAERLTTGELLGEFLCSLGLVLGLGCVLVIAVLGVDTRLARASTPSANTMTMSTMPKRLRHDYMSVVGLA